MKAFIIRLKDHRLSEKLSDDCIKQAKKFNIKVEKFDAIFGKDYKSHLKQLNIKIHSLVPEQKMSDGHYGNFLSHYYLWLKCIEENLPFLILEHDGYFVRYLPDNILSQFTDVLKLDLFHPYQSEYNQKVNENINQTITFSEIIKGQPNKRKPAGFYSAGAYAYIIKPDACKKLITWININGFLPTDNQLGLDVVNVKQPNVTLVRHHHFFSIDDNILKYSTAKNTYNKYKMNTNENKHKELTQKYSTWGDKLLQHTDVLHSIQYDKKFKPITIQLAPTEVCSSGCPFCSVAERPLKSYLPFVKIKKILEDFKTLGAKSLEITGGGEPLIYIDKETKDDINSIIEYAHQLKYDIGIITNTLKLTKIKSENFDKLNNELMNLKRAGGTAALTPDQLQRRAELHQERRETMASFQQETGFNIRDRGRRGAFQSLNTDYRNRLEQNDQRASRIGGITSVVAPIAGGIASSIACCSSILIASTPSVDVGSVVIS